MIFNLKFKMNSNLIDISNYDTDVTIQYKAVKIFELPISLISAIPSNIYKKIDVFSIETKKYFYINTIELVRYYMYEGDNFDIVYRNIKKYNIYINPDNIFMIYYHIMLLENFPIETNLYKDFNECYQSISADEYQKYHSNELINIEYENWIESSSKSLSEDLSKLENIIETENELDKIYNEEEPIEITAPIILSAEYVFHPKMKKHKEIVISKLEGLDIFNGIIVNKYLPIAVYISHDGTRHTKIYSPTKTDSQPNYNNIIFSQSESQEKNIIYMKYWLPKKLDFLSKYETPYEDERKETFRDMVYNLEYNNLFINITFEEGINEFNYFDIIQKNIPTLKLGKGTEIKVGGYFQIYSSYYSQIAFSDMILNDPVLSTYLFLDENQKLLADKKKFDIHFKSIASTEDDKKSVSISLRKKITKDQRYVNIFDKERVRALVRENNAYIHCIIRQATSREVLDSFMEIFKLLMKRVFKKQEKIDAKLFSMYPILRDLESFENNIEDVDTDSRICRIDLQENAPDLFLPNYSKRCPCENQPSIVFSEKELEYWKKKKRQVISFPNVDPKFLFVCPRKDRKYIGVKINKDLPNKEQYPYIPCCFQENHTSVSNSKYQNYLNNIKPQLNVGAKADKKISTRKILAPDRIAFTPRAVENILKRYSRDYSDIVRYGIPYGINCFLHCICFACDDPSYIKKTGAQREFYVDNMRKTINQSIYPSLLKQELFDYSDNEILEILNDNEAYFNPDIFYRAVEEVFNINIYVFTSIPDNEKDNDFLGNISIPRSQLFHSRPLRIDRPTVVVLKVKDIEMGTHEHCELIVDYNEENNTIAKLFGENMTKICHSILVNRVNTLTFGEDLDKTDKTIFSNVYKNIYQMIDHFKTFKLPAKYQYIDEYGKMRGIVFEIKVNNEKKLFTLITVPSQPENLPTTNEIFSINIEDIYSYLGLPNSYSVNRSENHLILWYNIGNLNDAEGVYINSMNKKLLENKGVFEIDKAPLFNKNKSLITDVRKNRKDANIILQILKWIFSQNTETSIDEFIKLYFVENLNVEYDFERLDRVLPATTKIADSIKKMEKIVPSLFSENKIHVSFYKKLKDLFISFSKMNLETKTSRIISNFYLDVDDFDIHFEVKIFMNDTDLFQWLRTTKSLVEYSKLFTIYDSITQNLISNKEPYIYRDVFKRVWLIQNVQVGNFYRALSVSKEWDIFGLNIGYEIDISAVDKNKLLKESYIINRTTNSGELFAVNINKGEYLIDEDDSKNYLNILYYGNNVPNPDSNNFAAMMQIM